MNNQVKLQEAIVDLAELLHSEAWILARFYAVDSEAVQLIRQADEMLSLAKSNAEEPMVILSELEQWTLDMLDMSLTEHAKGSIRELEKILDSVHDRMDDIVEKMIVY